MMLGTDGVLVAYPEFMSIDVTIDHGFWAVTSVDAGEALFCSQIAGVPSAEGEAIERPVTYTKIVPLQGWSTDSCSPGKEMIQPAWKTYESPFYGYKLGWDGLWTMQMKNSWWVGGPEGGYDQIRLGNDTSGFAVTGTRQWDGDPDACLDGVMQGVADAAGNYEVEWEQGIEPASVNKRYGFEASRMLRYHFLYPLGFYEERLIQIDCITMPDRESQVVLLFEAPVAVFEQQLAERARMLTQFDLPE